jgi:peptide chain release factor 3
VPAARGTPILTSSTKMDREVQDPMTVMDEIERELGMAVVFTWPVGMLFHRYDRREDRNGFQPRRGNGGDVIEASGRLDNAEAVKLSAEYAQAQGRSNWSPALTRI